ncbi:MAG: hypothetical protein Q8L55_10185 [Phycisphaerales bacterium]|nr:hypothetical protein [Phycisphaerales bacterium]
MSNSIGSIIAGPAAITRSFGELMLKDVPADKAARFATPGGKAVVSNHPVFVFGHLSLYNRRVLAMCNQPEGVAAIPAEWDGLFKAGVECKDDADGKLYPSLPVVTKAFFEGFDAAVAAVMAADDDLLRQVNPLEGRIREMCPLRGQFLTFVLNAHPMTHFGQVSAWRRMIGLGSAM